MGTAKGRVAGSKNVDEAELIAAYVAKDSYESVGASLADAEVGRPNGLKADTVMNRIANIRKRLLERADLTEAQIATINEKLGPKRKKRTPVGEAAASILGL